MTDIVIFGTGQIAELAKFYIEKFSSDRVVGFTVNAAYQNGDSFLNLPLVAWETLEVQFPPTEVKLLGPLSYARMNDLRKERYLEGKSRGYHFASFIHPDSHINTEDIGENSFILEGNIIQPFARIGIGAMIWSGNHIGHHSEIGNFSFLASGIAIGGGTKLGEGCFISGQAGIESQLDVGRSCFIGSGVIITRHLPDESVVPTAEYPAARYSSARLKRLKFR